MFFERIFSSIWNGFEEVIGCLIILCHSCWWRLNVSLEVSNWTLHLFLLWQHHLKKLQGRRLDFDYKKKRQGKVTEDDMKQALEKFDDSKEVAEQSMFNLLESDVRSVTWPVLALVHNPFHASVEFHFTYICPNVQRVFPTTPFLLFWSNNPQ